MNPRWTACLIVGVLVAVVVYAWFQEQSPPDAKSPPRSPPSKSRARDESTDHLKVKSPPNKETDRHSSKTKENILSEQKTEVAEVDGVIKYDCRWTKATLPTNLDLSPLIAARNKLRRLGLIGVDARSRIGFGNISLKRGDAGNTQTFFITASQTASVQNGVFCAQHISHVTDFALARNRLFCSGAMRASSESLTHAAVYSVDPRIRCVVHVHSEALWERFVDELPTSRREVEYGTVAMAREVQRLWAQSESESDAEERGSMRETRLFVMGGHRNGLVSFGYSVEEAMSVMIGLLESEQEEEKREKEMREKDKDKEVVTMHPTASMSDINIIDDYATPTMTAKNTDFVEIGADQLTL